MSRTAITVARTAITSARTAIASARTAVASYRISEIYGDLGITHLWDWRTGYQGVNSTSVGNMLGNGIMEYAGTTAIGSVYTAGQYQADLESTNSDYFQTNPRFLRNGATAMTWFAWIKRESAGAIMTMMSQFETVGNRRGFVFTFLGNNTLRLSLSSAGTAATIADYTTTPTLADTSAWHFIVATYDTTNRGQFNIDNSAATTTLTGGTDPASIFSPGSIGIMIGARIPSSPQTFFDGKVGICGISTTTTMSTAQISILYNYTRQFYGV